MATSTLIDNTPITQWKVNERFPAWGTNICSVLLTFQRRKPKFIHLMILHWDADNEFWTALSKVTSWFMHIKWFLKRLLKSTYFNLARVSQEPCYKMSRISFFGAICHRSFIYLWKPALLRNVSDLTVTRSMLIHVVSN